MTNIEEISQQECTHSVAPNYMPQSYISTRSSHPGTEEENQQDSSEQLRPRLQSLAFLTIE